MKRLFSTLVFIFLFMAAFVLPGFTTSQTVTLVYVSHMADIDANRGGSGYPELVTLLKGLRAENTRVMLFHGGNFLGPSALSSYDKGAHMIGILNSLQPDVLGLGRRDFMHKEDELVLRSGEAVFPIVCSNIYDPISLEAPGSTMRGYILKTPVPIGFLALVSPEMQTTYVQRRLVTVGGQELLPDLASGLRKDGARFVTASIDFMPDNVETTLAESTLDLLFISGTPESGLSIHNGRALATHTGNGDDALVIRLLPDAKGGLSIAGHEVHKLADYAPDAATTAQIERYSKLFANLTQTEVGKVLTVLKTHTKILRSGENAMGNLIADAIRDYYGADIAFINSGGIRGNREYPAGTTLRRGDLQNEMPLHDISCFINVRGETILAALEHGVSQIGQASGRFLQVSGMEYVYDASAAPGSRIASVKVGGKALEPNKIYSVSLPEYLGTHGDGFYMFPGECNSKAIRPPQELVEVVRVYMVLHSPVSPRVEGRIKALGAAD